MDGRASADMGKQEMEVVVLGTGTSAGVPVVACDCPICTSTDPMNQRLRSSILLRDGERNILVDCGSDFRMQALRHRIMRLDSILLTHAHSDHISGLDEVRIYNWKQGHPIPVYGSELTLDSLRKRFDYLFNPMQLGGGVSDLELHPISAPFTLHGHRILPLEVMHGKLPVTGFRIGNFGYVTDASDVPEETVRRLMGVRYLILNALRYKPHPTHLNIEQATAIAQRIGAERTWFTHITHDLDHETVNNELPATIQLGHDGLTFRIDPSAPMPTAG